MVDILHKVGIKASTDQVYTALTTCDGLAGWWTTNTRGEGNVAGGVIDFRFSVGGVELGGCEVKVVELTPGHQVLWQVIGGPAEWIGTRIAFELKQEDDCCIVLFKHQGWREPVEFMHHCSTKWAMFMMSLKSLLETGTGAPNPDDVRVDSRS